MAIYQAIYDGPPRNYTATRTTKRYIAIHNTANDASAENEASYAKRRTDSVSSHYYVDSNSVVQSLNTDYRAWHAGSKTGNDRAISYEITGVNGWSRAQWLDRVAWGLLAAQIRKDCAAHNIVARDLTVTQIKAGSLTGVITHNEMRLAWGGTTHTDPGPNFPMDHLLALVNEQEDEVSWTEQLKLPKWALEKWDDWADGKASAAGIATSGYAHSRSGSEAAHAALRETRAGFAAVLAAVAGKDVAGAVQDTIRTEFARLGPALAAELSDVPAERVEAALRAVLGSLDEPA